MRNKKRVRLLAYALNRNLEGNFALRIRFSAARYSFCSRSSWFTEPAGDRSECFASQALPDLGEGGALGIYVLFFLHLESRRVSVAGITRHPAQEWMEQIARSATQETWGYLDGCRYVLHDRDTKFCASFRSVLAASGVKTLALPARSPNLNALAERWVRPSRRSVCRS